METEKDSGSEQKEERKKTDQFREFERKSDGKECEGCEGGRKKEEARTKAAQAEEKDR